MPDRLAEKAVIAFPHTDRNHIEFTLCLSDLTRFDTQHGRRLVDDEWRITSENSGNVAVARNIIVRTFLEHTTADWLWFIDTDEPFDKDTLERLIMSADPVERPILSGLVFAQAANRALPVSPVPVIWDPEVGDFREQTILPTERYWRVGSAGCGCLLIHRTVLEAVGEAHKDDAFPWFKWAQHDRHGQPDVMSEDFTFSLRAQALGFPIWVDTTIECGHVKRRVLTSRDYWAQIPAGLRPRKTFAIVPVKDQFAHTARIVAELREQAVDGIIVIDNGSGRKTRNWLESQDDIALLEAPDAGIHGMWNMGAAFALNASPAGCDLFFVNNDVTLGPGCVGQLSKALAEYGDLAVVCPNYDKRQRRTVASCPQCGGSGRVRISEDEVEDCGKCQADGYVDAGPLPPERRTDICADRYDGTGGIAGFAFMVKGEVFHSYRFPEDCKWWYGDNDLLLTVQASGLSAAIVLDASCEHLDGGGKTGDWESPEMQAQLAADRDAFLARWSAPLGGGGSLSGGSPPSDTPIPAPTGPIQ